MFVDSHCHIEDEEVLKRAFDAGVRVLLNAGNDLDDNMVALEFAKKYKNVWASVGVHPDNVLDKLDTIKVEDIIKASLDDNVVAIGECGLDYHYGSDFKDEQREMFLRHIEASGKTGLPIMIHHREAENDMVDMLKDGIKKYPNLKGVIHCFTSTFEFAKEVLDLGFYISASGIITFKSGCDILEVFKGAPKDRVLIETDSPYLAPVPFRGKINEPKYVIKTAEKLAEAWNVSLEEVSNITMNNFYNLYQKAKR